MASIDSIHLSTLKAVLVEAIKSCNGASPEKVADHLVEKLFTGMGRCGKVGRRYPGFPLEFYSEYATLDFPSEKAYQLFIIEG